MDLRTSQMSRLERLPAELLHKILSNLKPYSTQDVSHKLRNVLPTESIHDTTALEAQHNLLSCLTTSRNLQEAIIPILYQRVSLSTYSSLLSFHQLISLYPQLGVHVKTLDLSNLRIEGSNSHIIINSDARQAWHNRVQESSDFVTKWLFLMPRLQELKTPLEWRHEPYSGSELNLDIHILKRLLRGQIPSLRSLEWGPTLTPEFMSFLSRHKKGVSTQVRKMVIRSNDVETTTVVKSLLEIMPRIQDLDFGTSNVFLAEALPGLPPTTKLRSLITTIKPSFALSSIQQFIRSNPGIFNRLQTLHLLCNASGEEVPQLESVDEISTLITLLPPTLRSLNLSGFATAREHLPLLTRYCPKLEELSIDTGIQIQDIEGVLLPPHTLPDSQESHTHINNEEQLHIELKHTAILQPMVKAIAICKLRKRINSVSFTQSPKTSTQLKELKYLDIGNMSISEQRKLFTSLLLSGYTSLERIRIGEWGASDEILGYVCMGVGWRVGSRGRECWIERVGSE